MIKSIGKLDIKCSASQVQCVREKLTSANLKKRTPVHHICNNIRQKGLVDFPLSCLRVMQSRLFCA